MPPPPVFFNKKKVEDKHPTSNATMLARMGAQNLMKKVTINFKCYIHEIKAEYSIRSFCICQIFCRHLKTYIMIY